MEAVANTKQTPLRPGEHRIIAIIDGKGFVVKSEQVAKDLGAEHIVDKFYYGGRDSMTTILQ